MSEILRVPAHETVAGQHGEELGQSAFQLLDAGGGLFL